MEFQRFCPKYQEEATQTVGEMKKRIKRGESKKREEGNVSKGEKGRIRLKPREKKKKISRYIQESCERY